MAESNFQWFGIGGLSNQVVGAVLASANTLPTPDHLIHHVSGTAVIKTIPVPYAGFGGVLILIPDAIFTWDTTGNLALAGTAVVNKALFLVYDTLGAKWVPSYIA